jgi:type VI secretion system protein ImpC
MSERFSFGKLDVHLTASSDRLERTPTSEVPFRIAILGDFSGQAGRENSRTRPARLRPILIDRDNFDEVLQKLGVEAHLQLGTSGQRLILRFHSLEDFHPDQILSKVSLFSKLRETRKKLSNPSTFAEGAAEVSRWADVRQVASQPAPASEKGSAESRGEDPLSAGFLLDGLAERGQSTAGRSGLRDFDAELRDMVQPHLAPRDDPQQAELVAHVDIASGELLEAILHHPEFQALEASWRGVYFLVSQLDTGSDLKIYLLDFTKEELASDLSSSEVLSRTVLYRAMVEETVQTPGATPWALLAGNYVFDLESDDIESLGRVAKIAAAAGAQLVAAASASFIGCESLAATPDPDDWSLAGGTAVSQAWEAVRRLPEASSLGLILPRFLLRLPYGKKSDPIESLPFEELSPPAEHEHYLWGNPCFAAALLLARTFTESGWQFLEGIQQDIEGLPLHVFEEAGGSVVKPCAEVLMTQRAAEKVSEAGIMPLASMKGEDRVRLLGVHTVARPETSLVGRWRRK